MKSNHSKWTKEEIDILKEKGAFNSSYELLKLIKDRSRIAIAVKCRRLGIFKTKEFKSDHGKKARGNVRNPYKILDWNLKFEDFSYEVQQVILGSLLGDGFLTQNSNKSKEYCFREGHGEKQKEYLKWKANLLKEFKPKLSGTEFFTPTHPIFTDIKRNFYISSKRKNNLINPYIKKINWLSFFIWYLDDGGLQSGNRDFTITSKLFHEKQLNYLINLLNQKLGLGLIIRYYKHKEGIMARIKVLAKDRDKVKEKFDELFKNYNLPDCIYYKINLRPLKIKAKYHGKGQ